MRPFTGTVESAQPYGGFYNIQLACRTASGARRYVELSRSSMEALQAEYGDLRGRVISVSKTGLVSVNRYPYQAAQ